MNGQQMLKHIQQRCQVKPKPTCAYLAPEAITQLRDYVNGLPHVNVAAGGRKPVAGELLNIEGIPIFQDGQQHQQVRFDR